MDTFLEVEFLERKKAINAQLEKLIEKGVSVVKLAEFLSAQEFLREKKVGSSKGSDVLVFDVKAFVESEARKLNPILLPDNLTEIDEIILPPDEGKIITGSGEGIEKKKIIPRSYYLVEVLTELKLHYGVVMGKNDHKMVREESYQIFYLPEKKKLIFVNNEEGNTTFIVHEVNDKKELVELSRMTKEELKDPAGEKVVTVINWNNDSERWKEKIRAVILTKEVVVNQTVEKQQAVNREGAEQYEKAPEGWLTNRGLANKLFRAKKTIKRCAEKYRKDHPEWFRGYLDVARQTREHYHPDLVVKIEEDVTKNDKAPTGWMTGKSLADKFFRDHRTIKRYAEKYKKDYPGWFEMYLDVSGKPAEHYHPDLIAKIEEDATKYEKAPEGWLTNRGLGVKLSKTLQTIKIIAEKYKKDYPGWFEMYLDVSGKPAEHYHPDLIAKIEEDATKYEKAPEGWLTNRGLGDKLFRDKQVIQKRADRYRKDHPEWFRVYLDRIGHPREHYNPNLILRVEEDLR